MSRAVVATPVDGVALDVFRPPMPRNVAWRRRVTRVVAVAFLASAVVWGANVVVHACGGLSSGVRSVDGECVGVTDGSFIYSNEIKQIEEAIKKENDRVVSDRTKTHVTVALLSPLTATKTSPLTSDKIRRALQGAYVAQRRANGDKRDFGDPHPLIRLVLANEGSHQRQWRPVVNQLVDMAAGGDHPLVAVIGLGVSVVQTKQAAIALAEHKIPMVAAVVTADGPDGLDRDQIPGFVRVSPTNSDYAEALRMYLDRQSELQRGMMVYDDSDPDLFVATLREDYDNTLGSYLYYPSQSFCGIARPGGNCTSEVTPRLFDSITTSICQVTPDMLFYAGRAIDLSDFIKSLARRVCKDNHITIMAGATGLTSIQKDEATLRDGNITIVNAASTDPCWSQGQHSVPTYYQAFQSEFQELLKLDTEELSDGYAIMHHDALVTAVKATRLVATQADTQRPSTAADVRGQLFNLHSGHEIHGASGTLVFTDRRPGEAGGKPVPIIRIPASGSPCEPLPYEPYTTPLS